MRTDESEQPMEIDAEPENELLQDLVEKHCPMMITDLKIRGDLIIVGDILRAISVHKVVENKRGGIPKIESISELFKNMGVTNIVPFSSSDYMLFDRQDNMFFVQMQNGAQLGANKNSLAVTACASLGDSSSSAVYLNQGQPVYATIGKNQKVSKVKNTESVDIAKNIKSNEFGFIQDLPKYYKGQKAAS